MVRITLIVVALLCFASQSSAQHFASGIKIGEVDQNSAIVWVRLTEEAGANFDLLKPGLKQPMPEKIVAGQRSEVRVQLNSEQLKDGTYSVQVFDWVSVVLTKATVLHTEKLGQ